MKRKNSKSIEDLEREIRLLHERIDDLSKDIHSNNRTHHLSSKMDDNDFDFSENENDNENDNESSSILNDSLHKTKSGKFVTTTHIAYLYSVPLVKEEKSKILSMGLPIDHNAEIDDIVEGLEATNKMVNFRKEIGTIESFQELFLKKPKVVHLSCHGDYDKESKSHYLAFESKKILGMMEKFSMDKIKNYSKIKNNLKSIECILISACHSQ